MTWLAGWLWQGCLVTALVAVGLACARSLGAATRHRAWWLTLLAVLALPIVQAARPAPNGEGDVAVLRQMSPADLAGLETGIVTVAEAPGAWVRLPSPSPHAAKAAVAIWGLVVVASLVRLAYGLWRLRQLKAGAGPAIPRRDLPLWTRATTSGRRVSAHVSDAVAVPCVIGYRRPLILVPRRWLSRLDASQLDLILLHEHAHVARRDDWSRLVQSLVEAVARLHPAVWWIGRQIDLEREAACDDVVLSRTGSPHPYARCLADAAATQLDGLAPRGVPALSPGMVRARSMLRRRVARVLDPRRHHASRPARGPVAAHALLLVGATVATPALGPLVIIAPVPAAGPPVVVRSEPTAPAALLPESRLVHAPEGHPPAAVPVPPAPARAERRRVSGADGSVPVAQAAGSGFPAVAPHPAAAALADRAPSVSGVLGVVPRDAGASRAAANEAALLVATTSSAPWVLAGAASPAPGAGAGSASRGAWRQAAEAGAAIGSGTGRAGAAVGQFFTRGGRAVAASFRPAGTTRR